MKTQDKIDMEKSSEHGSNRSSGDKPSQSEDLPPDDNGKTEREIERAEEDEDFIPVILKRTDEAQRHPDDILEYAITEGLEQLNRTFLSLLLSAMAAGLILGFSVLSVATVESQGLTLGNPFLVRLLSALVYPLGFVLCIMSGTQLFTEHTATAVYPVLDRRGTTGQLLRLWCVVLLGNLIGALISAGFLVGVDPVVEAELGYVSIGQHLVGYSAGSLLISALLAGWLMALGAWLLMATPPTLSQMAAIYIVTFIIGIGRLHHSIAGSVEMFTAYLISDQFSIGQVLHFVLLTVCGNLVGGSIFVGLLNYGHIRQTQRTAKDD